MIKKKILFIVSFIISLPLFAQYGSSISYVPNEKTVIAQTFGISNDMGAYVGINQSYVYVNNQNYKPYPYINRFGLNYGFISNGINVGFGVKLKRDIDDNIDYFLPHALVSFHPIRFSTQKNSGVDFEFLIDFSTDNTNYGFGVLIPFWLNRY
jgi:hypothetical protein